MKILSHSHAGVRAAKRHPALQGLRQMARGAFCSVYDKGDTVLKLTCDKIQYAFSAECLAPEGPCFPKLVHDYGAVGETDHGLDIYLMEMEKLAPIGRSAPREIKHLAYELEWHVGGSYTRNYWRKDLRNTKDADRRRFASVSALEDNIKEGRLPADLLRALDGVRQFVSNYDASLDLHKANFMMRGEQIILNDVVCDPEAIIDFQARAFNSQS